jgi:peptide/nickel transport system permease protein
MLRYIGKRIFIAIPTLIVVSMISFFVIQLPPGDFLTAYVASLRATNELVNQEQIDALTEQYGLGQPMYVQYLKWVEGIVLHGDFGYSMEWKTSVSSLIWQRLALTVVLSGATLLFTWLLAIPIGILSATKQYSIFDYVATFLGFVGLGIPNFLFALVLMWIAFAYFGSSVGGLFSPGFLEAGWSLAKVWDMLKHLWIPMAVVGLGGTASLIRTMRANLLDELHKPYVMTARAKGVAERALLIKYPVRVALNPFISTIGWALPGLISGATIVSVVLSLPMAGPLLLRALQSQDMYLAGSFILLLSALTILGTLISDILLAWADPRIRFE